MPKEHKEYPVAVSRRYPVIEMEQNTVARRRLNLDMLKNLHEREVNAEKEWMDMFALIDNIEWDAKQTEFQVGCISETNSDRVIWENRWRDNARTNAISRRRSIQGTIDRRKKELAECEKMFKDLEFFCSR